jgi:hypothetical protein
MSVYADLLLAFNNAIELMTNISQILSIADFSNHKDIQSIYNAIYQTNVGSNALTSAFKSYAESHSIYLSDPA